MGTKQYPANCYTHADAIDAYEHAAAERDALKARVAELEAATNGGMNMKHLTCCCCGASTRGHQWWNRDIGFGLCKKCADWIKASGKQSDDEMARNYGERGIHYAVADEQQAA